MIERKKIQNNQLSEEKSSDNELHVKLQVKIGNKIIESDLDEALSIPTVDKLNPAVISNMMAEIPSLHGRWNFLYNEAAFEYDILGTKVEVWIARKCQELRRKLAGSETRVTDKMVDEHIKADPEYQELNDQLAAAKKNMKNILAQANGFGEKGDRLTSIASMMKWEAESYSGQKTSKSYSHIRNDQDNKPVDKWPS